MRRILLLLILLTIAGNSQAQSGANSADVLGKLLYTAIKTNNFNMIQNYCLTEDQLNQVRQQGQMAAPDQLQALTADEYNTSLRSNFEMAVRERSSDTLTWKGVGLKTVKMNPDPAMGTAKQQVSLYLTDDQERDFQVQFDTMSLNNNYYFMGNIRLVNK